MTVYDMLVHSKNVYGVEFRDSRGVILNKMNIVKAITSQYQNMNVMQFMPFLMCNGCIKLIIYV